MLLEQDAFSSLAIRTGFQMFGFDCDIALNAKLALKLICKRIATEDIDAMYKLIVIDKSFNSYIEGEQLLSDAIRELVT